MTTPKTGAEIIEEWRNPPDGLYRSHTDLAQMIDKRIAEVEAERDAKIFEIVTERNRFYERIRELEAAQQWISVKDRLPECDMTPNSFGVQVLVWPPFESDGCSPMRIAFYGCRQTDEPNFYLFGRVFDPTHWMPTPPAPADTAKGE